jgi:hypothetical protein
MSANGVDFTALTAPDWLEHGECTRGLEHSTLKDHRIAVGRRSTTDPKRCGEAWTE